MDAVSGSSTTNVSFSSTLSAHMTKHKGGSTGCSCQDGRKQLSFFIFNHPPMLYMYIYIYNAPQLWMAELIKGVHTYCIMCSCTVSTVHSVLFMNWTKATAHISPTACLHFIESILKVHLDTQLRKETTDNSWNSRCRGAVLLCIWKRQQHVRITDEVSTTTEPSTSHLFYHFMNDWQSFSSGKSFAG